MSSVRDTPWLQEVRWNRQGLVCAIVQDQASGRVLMQAWMNRDALAETVRTGYAVYWSRSRRSLWEKGEQSGHRQKVGRILLDCDRDAVLLQVEQIGGIACHTGRESCFFRELDQDAWHTREPVIRPPRAIYGGGEH